ncbi:MAG: hypothetical protein IPP34_12865 [Bacteroidetes bacterium]|nr:hypothetical protein [Bacteroidota bacterium]
MSQDLWKWSKERYPICAMHNGNILFYTNGIYISDATGDTMQNGSGPNPSVYTSWYPDGLPHHK